MNVNSIITKGYRKKGDFEVRINKPNFRKAQNERKLIYSKGLQKKNDFAVRKNKPNSNPISSKPKIACRKIWPHLYFLRNHLLLVLGGDLGYIIKLGFIREVIK